MDEGPHRDGTPSRRGNRSPSRRKNKRHDAGSASSSSISEDGKQGHKIKAPYDMSSSVDLDVGQGSAADGLRKYKSTTPLQFSSKSKMEVAQHALEGGDDGKTDKPESWVSHYIEREPGGQYIKLGVVIETKIRLDPHLPFGAQNIQFPGPPNMQFSAAPPVPPDVRDAHVQGRGAQLSDVSDEKYSDESGRDIHDHHHPPLDNFLYHERQDHNNHHKHGEEDFLPHGHQDHRDHHKHGEEEYIEEHYVGREEHEDHLQRHKDRYEEIKRDPAPSQQHYPQEPDRAPPPHYYGHHGEPGGEHGRGMGISERGIPLGSHGLPLPLSSARRRSSWALGEIPLSSLAAPPRSSQHHRRRSSLMPHEVIREH